MRRRGRVVALQCLAEFDLQRRAAQVSPLPCSVWASMASTGRDVVTRACPGGFAEVGDEVTAGASHRTSGCPQTLVGF